VTEAGQLKVCFTHTADKRKLRMWNIT
jgi:hypothetical protein